MIVGRGEATGSDVPAHSTGWVARRLGVASATLRTWDRRYGIGPTGRTAGGHRRYLLRDLDRLERMRRLMLAGVPTAEAARVSAEPSSGPAITVLPADRRQGGRRHGSPERRTLLDAAMALDQPATEALLTRALQQCGVVATWNELIVPVLAVLGEYYERRRDCIAVEHLFTECVRSALSGVTSRPRRWDGCPAVLLACLDAEQHSLPLHALGAALAEIGCPTRILGPSVPVDALVSATRQLAPRAVFTWAQTTATARVSDLAALPRRRPPTRIVVGGPGWRNERLPTSVTYVDSITDAIIALSHNIVASAS